MYNETILVIHRTIRLKRFSPSPPMSEVNTVDKADNAFMLICTALVFFMTIPGIALFYGDYYAVKTYYR